MVLWKLLLIEKNRFNRLVDMNKNDLSEWYNPSQQNTLQDSEKQHLKILVIEDSAHDAELIIRKVKKSFQNIHWMRVETADEMRAALTNNDWHIVVSDYRLPGFDGMAALDILKQHNPEIPFIVVSGAIGEDTALSLVKAGASDYLFKDHLTRLPHAIERELRDARQLKKHEGDLEQLNVQLMQAQKMESVGRLAGGVAHDFNNMLGVILGHSEMAMDLIEENHPIQEDLQQIFNTAKRAANLTRQLLAFAQKQVISPQILDLNETIVSVMKMLQRLVGENINIVWKPETNLWKTKIDPAQIDQILANLAANSRDATTGSGTITIETRNLMQTEKAGLDTRPEHIAEDYILLSFADTGCGMDQSIIEHLFEPFFTTKEQGKGTGLGLSTIYGIVKQNHGFICVDSSPQNGTVFRIYLPRFVGAEEVADDILSPIPCGNETILLVEDEESVLALTRQMLKKQGYNVLAAQTPEEALRIFEQNQDNIQLLLSDIIMPSMNGCELAQKIAAIRPEIKLLLMSGYTADAINERVTREINFAILHKPFTIRNLAIKVRQALEDDKQGSAKGS
jgi:signal transduction histidine kinase